MTKKLVLYSSTLSGITKTLTVEGNRIAFKRRGTVYNLYHADQLIARHITKTRAGELMRQADDQGQRLRLEQIELT